MQHREEKYTVNKREEFRDCGIFSRLGSNVL